MICNGDFMASHYELWQFAVFIKYYLRYEWPTLVTVILIGWVIAREVISAVIRVQRKAAVGQQVYESGPAAHLVKQGTPTMGGLSFPLAAAAAAVFLATRAGRQRSLFHRFSRRGSRGDRIHRRFPEDQTAHRARPAGALEVGAADHCRCRCGVRFSASPADILHIGHRARKRSMVVRASSQPPAVWFYVLAIAAIVGCANAVNLTDGVDGLAASVALPTAHCTFRLGWRRVGLAVAAALIVFLRYNKHPAKVFMGDTGSLTLGALLAFIAIKEHVLLFLPLLGIVFVVEALIGDRAGRQLQTHRQTHFQDESTASPLRTFRLDRAAHHEHVRVGVSVLACVIFCAIVNFSNVRMLWHW